MLPPLQLVGYGPVAWLSTLPKGWKGKILPGSEVYSYEGELGHIIIQQYSDEQWSIRYAVFRFLKKIVLHWKEEAALCIRFVLQGDFKYKGENKNYKVREGAVNLCWAPERETYARCSANQEYIIFQFQYAPSLVQELHPRFPETSIPSEHKSSPIEKEWNKTINEILDAPYDDEMLRFFFETRVRDILLFLMLQPGAGIRYEGLTSEVVDKVREVDRLILRDLSEWLHISVLAKKVSLSQFKLKLAYKRIIGMNMFERLREARLEKGRKLLLETDYQIKLIYRMVGYKSLSGFEDAFKEKYALPPLQYRKKYQPRG
jgi:AraC-like DNA-binding protein